MNFVFFGTDDYSVAILEKLISDYFYPVLVVSQPDKPVGRKQIMTPPAIKHVCDTHRLPLLQPQKTSEIIAQLQAAKADVFIVASFGQIIPQAVLDIPSKGAINVHTSLLPRYRGASPIQAAIANGEIRTGVTIMLMDAALDHGPILHQQALEISPTETNSSLRARLATLGADTLCKVLPYYINGKIKPVAQDDTAATFTKLITKDDGRIDWKQSAAEIDRQVRAYQDWPTAWTMLPNMKRLKIIRATPLQRAAEQAPGTLDISKDGVFIATGQDWLSVQELQVEGKGIMLAASFIPGYQSLHGQICA